MKLHDNMMKILLLLNVAITAWKKDYNPRESESHSYTNTHHTLTQTCTSLHLYHLKRGDS